MKIYSNISEFTGVDRPIITTGTFDGVHFGHRKIIDRLTKIADSNDGESVILTFSPHPRMVLFPDDHGLQLINTIEEKIELLQKAGVQHLIIHPFTVEFSRMTSIQFVRDILVSQFNTYKLVIGYDHHFGRNREGSFEHLKEYSPLYGFEVEEIPVQLLDDVGVSSTKIRNALLDGKVDLANDYLGYQYPIYGYVIKGKQIGRKIGFPTANLLVEDSTKLIPKDGVYSVDVLIENVKHQAMMNIGQSPTIGANSQRLEVHIFDFDQDIYGQNIKVFFKERIRDEVHFESLDFLKEQLRKDKNRILNK
ncbi:bifunctional riboflavin kinase/FAD synthetase [Flavobacteriales bacterium]|nr:bifunctional riboflavin kinase/FAD synthetase [Flavobacteriales bacterium]